MIAQDIKELTAEVNLLSHLLRKAALNRHWDDALPPAALHILQLLAEKGSMTVPDLGRIRMTSRQNIQIAVNRLRAFGWVEHTQNPQHKRSTLVRLTAAGQVALEGALLRESGHDLVEEAKVTQEDLLAATEVLRKLREALAHQKPPGRTRSRVTRHANDLSTHDEALSVSGPETAKASDSFESEAPLEEMPVSLL